MNKHLGFALVFATAFTGVSYAQTTRPTTPPASAPSTKAPMTTPPASSASTSTSSAMTAAPKAADEYKTEAEATRTCGTDPVVWANLRSKALHTSSDRYYGKTKEGAFMCQSVATREGMHMPKSKN